MKCALESKFDDAGVLRSPDLHDGWLHGIIVSKDKRADLFVRDTDGKEYLISLGNVKQLRAKDFRESNLIFDITICSLKACPMSLLVELYGVDEKFNDSSFLERLKQAEESRDYSVIDIASSYGGSILALFREFEMSFCSAEKS